LAINRAIKGFVAVLGYCRQNAGKS